MSDEVPFGKYKGRPVSDMLADQEYMTWLEAQPWFREKFGRLLANRDTDAASRTPVHNKLQALFLDENYQRAFVTLVAADDLARAKEHWQKSKQKNPRKMAEAVSLWQRNVVWNEENAADYEGKGAARAVGYGREPHEMAASHRNAAAGLRDLIATADATLARVQDGQMWLKTVVEFECMNVDVRLRADVGWEAMGIHETGKVGAEYGMSGDYLIEIKPTVADEYPAVLRQMLRNKSRFLFVEQYTGEGVTEAQFVAIFKASGKRVVFRRDVEALLG